jgi:hypothetical protein
MKHQNFMADSGVGISNLPACHPVASPPFAEFLTFAKLIADFPWAHSA